MEQLRHHLQRARDTAPETPAPLSHAADLGLERLEPALQAGERCPYCRGGLSDGDLVSECVACRTHHHLTCFGENRGCSTHGCGSRRARSVRVGSALPPHAKTLICMHCQQAVGAGALVVRCSCRRILDVDCYEALGDCGFALCQGGAEIMTQGDVLARQKRSNALALEIVAGLLGSVSFGLAVAALNASRRDLPPAVVFGSVFFALFLVTIVLSQSARREARRLEALSPRDRQASAPGKQRTTEAQP